ncbi:DUF418 domain-containing protein [Streptomyces sp. NPDC051913]|uniref:DUF418 domain-containing protein n=1 Tax=Streptomyces sp. NPDC051913 TaxID=3365676 RepID=UPI0037CFA240
MTGERTVGGGRSVDGGQAVAGRQTRSTARVAEVDVLRGFALSGVLCVNALLMAGPYTVYGDGPTAGTADHMAAWLVSAFVAGKFYPLFAFLFGYAFVQRMRACRAEGVVFGPRHLRRTATLFTLGLLHAVLLYPGDILTTYAALALPLYALREASARLAVRAAAALVAVLSLVLLMYGLLTVLATGPSPGPLYGPAVADTVAAYRGDALSVIGAHVHALPTALGTDLLYAPQVFAAFLTGLAAAGLRLLERYGRDRRRLRAMVRRCLPLGVAGGITTAVCTNGPLDVRWFYVGQAVGVVTGPVLTAAYACGLLLWLSRPGGGGGRSAGVLAATGRLSLTHYLTQSLVLGAVFTGVGLGWYDRVGAAGVVAGCGVLYGVQVAVSAPLLARFGRGPAEAVVRWATRGSRKGRSRSGAMGER